MVVGTQAERGACQGQELVEQRRVNKVGTRKDQHNVGTPEKPRGQQTGFAGHSDQNREEKEQTPAVRGSIRKKTSKMFGDDSRQQTGSSSVTPSTNRPSTPGMRK